jgi:hypothetical protein
MERNSSDAVLRDDVGFMTEMRLQGARSAANEKLHGRVTIL